MTLRQVPVIDIAPFLGGDRDGKARVAAEVKQACEDIGFFVITGHGVDPALTGATYDVSRHFFDLPLAEKMTIERWADDVIRGYSPALKECLAESRGERGPGDLKESLTVGPPDVPDEPYFHCGEAGPALRREPLARASCRARGNLARILGCDGAPRLHAHANLRLRPRPRRGLFRYAG